VIGDGTPPPDDGVCEECDGPLGADYQERLVGMIGDIEIVELICSSCKAKEA
jgi:hypothetical protein